VDAVENLNSSYGYYIDESAWDNMADTFSVTAGAKELTGAGTYVGRERIREALNLRGPRGGRTPTFFTIHQLTQPVIHIADGRPERQGPLPPVPGRRQRRRSSGSWIGGIYENTAVSRTASGSSASRTCTTCSTRRTATAGRAWVRRRSRRARAAPSGGRPAGAT
jgi:hypothetical protein